jgi:copper chaperone CopZ
MKKILIIALLFIAMQSTAQIKNATLQASGLTCSMCSKAIYKSLTAVAFVQEVKSDIKNSSYSLTFKEGSTVDFDALKKAVTDAGFSVAKFTANIQFSESEIKNDAHVKLDGKTFHFINIQPQTLNGEKTVTLIDKNFLTAKEYKKYSKFTTMKCYETGVMENCCTKKNGTIGERIYHVTI